VMKAPASCRVPEVTTAHLQAHLDAALHIVYSVRVSQYFVAHFLNLSCNVLFHCVSCLWLVTDYYFLEEGAQKRKGKRGKGGGHSSLEISRSSKKL